MFVVEITAALVTLIAIANVTGLQPVTGPAGLGFQVQIAVWLWFTVLFATYAEAVAEARGRAQAATLRRTRSETTAHRRRADGSLEEVGSSELRKGDVIVVEEGETIPGDGDVIEGVGFVNEAAITGESAPVLKEPGTDIRSSVTGGTTLVSDRLVVTDHRRPGRDVPRPDDRPRRGREAPAHAQRDRPGDPARRPDHRLPDGGRDPAPVRPVRRDRRRHGGPRRPARLPHPDDDRRAPVRDRHRRHGPGRPVQRPGDERPGGRGLGRRRRHPPRQDRHDHLRQPARRLDHPGARRDRGRGGHAPRSCRRSSDETPEGRSIVELARTRLAALNAAGRDRRRRRLRQAVGARSPRRSRSAPRPGRAGSGRPTGRSILKGAVDAIAQELDGACRPSIVAGSDRIADQGATPLVAPRATAGSSASSSSRTPSRRASSSGSPSSAGWASGRS